MILHASILADHPERTARLLAAMLDGNCGPLRGPGKGTWVATGREPVCNLVEVLKRGQAFHHGSDEESETRDAAPVRENGFHVLLETPHDEEAVITLAAEHGVEARRTGRGVFELIEMWIDGCQLIELVTPPMAKAYRALFEPERLRETGARFLATPN